MSLSDVAMARACDSSAAHSDDPDRVDAAEQLAASLNAVVAAGRAGAFPDQTMQHLMEALVKIYAVKFDEGQRPALLGADSGISATAVLVTTSALMKASNLEIFELGMWQSWSGTR